MDEVFLENDPLAPETLHALGQRRDGPSVRHGIAHIAILVGTGWFLLSASDGWVRNIALVLHGIAHFSQFGLLHECCHRTAYTKRWANTLGGWIAALSQPMSPALMRCFHFTHHRHTHELARDPELNGFRFMVGWPRGAALFLAVAGLPILFARVGWALVTALVPAGPVWERIVPFVGARHQRRVAWESRLLLVVHGGILTAGTTLAPAILWLYFGLLLGHVFLGIYTTCEHRGRSETGSILERTRSLKTPRILRWLLWNMPYHAEHHAWPAIPWHALPDLHAVTVQYLPHGQETIPGLYLRQGRPGVEKKSAEPE
jgi:fatty acid desaturase